MKYALLIYGNETAQSTIPEAEMRGVVEAFGKVAGDLATQGKLIDAAQLAPTRAATTLRVRDGKRLVSDGPFAETHEQLGGYFIVDAENLDEAMEIASRFPTASNDTIEIRPLVG
jgi:hypothetical protein